MVSSIWFIAALSASILWGLGYVLSEIVLKNDGITPLFLAIFTSAVTLPIFIALGFYYNSFEKGIDALTKTPTLIPILVLEALTIVGGTFLIYISVAEKNAALTSIIESSYPLFALLFSFLILKEFNINIWTIVGMFSVMFGIAVIYLKGSG